MILGGGGYYINHYSFNLSVESWLKLDVLVVCLLLTASEDHFSWDLSFYNNEVDRNYWKGEDAFHLYHQVVTGHDIAVAKGIHFHFLA